MKKSGWLVVAIFFRKILEILIGATLEFVLN